MHQKEITWIKKSFFFKKIDKEFLKLKELENDFLEPQNKTFLNQLAAKYPKIFINNTKRILL